MKANQQGSLLIVLIIGIAIMAVLMGLYFTKDSNGEKSQFEQGQEGIEQAKDINQQSQEQSNRIKIELEQ